MSLLLKKKKKNATQKIKFDRVDRHKDTTVSEIDDIIRRVDALAIISPETDLAFRSLEENVKGITTVLDRYQDDAQRLCSDAAECGHVNGAKELEDCLIKLRTSRTKLDEHIHEQKTKLGILGQAGFSRNDVKLPVFLVNGPTKWTIILFEMNSKSI